MASNGVMTGNSDYSYTPLGWTCQVLTNTATVNLGYDVKAPVEDEKPRPRAVTPPRAAAK